MIMIYDEIVNISFSVVLRLWFFIAHSTQKILTFRDGMVLVERESLATEFLEKTGFRAIQIGH